MTHTTQIEKDIQSLKNNTISDYNFTTIISKYLKVYNYDKLIRIIRSYKFARTINGYKSLIRYFTDFDNKDLFDSFCTEDIIEIFSTMVNMYHKVKKNPKELFSYDVLNYNNLVGRYNIIEFLKRFSYYIDFTLYEYGYSRVELCEDICLYGTLNLLVFFEQHNLNIPLSYIFDSLLEKSYFNNRDNRIFYELVDRYKFLNLRFYNFDFLKKQYKNRRHNMKKINYLMNKYPESMGKIISLLIHDINSLRIEQLTYIFDKYKFKINVLNDYEITLINFSKLKNMDLFEKFLNKIEPEHLIEKVKLEYIYYFIKKNNLIINDYCLKIMNKYLGDNNKLLANRMINIYMFNSYENNKVYHKTQRREIIDVIHRLNEYKQDYYINHWWYDFKNEILDRLFFAGIDIFQLLKNSLLFSSNVEYMKIRFYENINKLFKNELVIKYINIQRLFKKIIFRKQKRIKSIFTNNILCDIKIPQPKLLVKNKRTIPVHLNPLNSMELLASEKMWITPKADGVYESINLSLYYPYINLLRIRRINFESELIKVDNKNINLVFGDHDLMVLLRKNFKFIEDNTNYIAYCDIELKLIMMKEKERFQKFIEQNKDKKENLWYPKISIKINYDILLEDLEKYRNSCYFETDGWIINDNFKLKHREHMTIDLKNTKFGFKDREGNVYKNVKSLNCIDDKIYRCYYNGVWEPRDLRKDKNYPNSCDVIENIINYNEGIWDYGYVQNLYEQYFKSNINNYYYGKNKRCNFRHLIPKYHSTINKYLTCNKSVIDLCCGYSGYFYRSKLKIKNYIGFDINMNVKEHLFNINTNWNSLYKLFYGKNLEKYDVILCNNAIQNAKDLEHFSNNVDTISHIGTRLILRFLDWDLMQTIDKAAYNENYVRIIEENKIKYYYSHSHNEPIIEKVYSSNDIIESLKKDWNLEFISEYKEDNKHCDFQKYLHFFKIAVFVKN